MAAEDADDYTEDINGNRLKVTRINGKCIPYHPGLKERMKKLPSMKGREDDITIVAYPKAGTHWTWEIATMLVRGKAETIQGEKEELSLEHIDPEVLDEFASPRTLNTHVFPDLYPRELSEKKTKILYVQRNPKDIFVSKYHHTISTSKGYENGKWPAYFEQSMTDEADFGNWFDYVLAWEKFFKENPDIPVLELYYEDMSKNLRGEVQKIAHFLGIKLDDHMCEEIAKMCTFQHMQKEKPKSCPSVVRARWINGEYKIYRKGVVGEWKNWFTVAQNERFDGEYHRRMKDSKTTVKYQ